MICINEKPCPGPLIGKVQEKAAQVIGSTDQQIKGLAKQEEGKTQKAVSDVKEVVKEIVKDVKKDVAPK